MERSIKGDYIGFTFGDVHSSELGLVRVSDGSRYNTDLLPPLEDKVGQVAGRDGEVLFGTNYKAKEIKVPVAFDNMTEETFRRLTQLLADKKPKSLWFDESPYKEWIVKSANVQDFKWVCFDESHNGKEKRIYKGEGTLIFKCRSPYAQSRVTYLDDPVDYIYVKEGYKIVKKDCGPFKIIKNIFSRNISKERLEGKYELDEWGLLKDNAFKDKAGNIFKPFSEWYNSLQNFASQNSEYYVLGTFLREPYDPYFFYNTQGEPCRIYYTNLSELPLDSNTIQVIDPFTKEEDTVNFSPIGGNIFNISNCDNPVLLLSKGRSPFFWNGSKYSISNKTVVAFVRYLHFDEKTPATLEDNYNFEEWKDASGLVLKEGYEKFNTSSNTMNSGDIEANFILTIKEVRPWAEIMDKEGEVHFLVGDGKKLILHKLEKVESECLQFDSKIKLIKGGTYDKENKKFLPDGKIYNFLIKKGDFFRLDVGKTYFTSMPVAQGQTELLNFEHKHYYYL